MKDKSIELFISYAPKDEMYLKNLKAHLGGLRRQGFINIWHDRTINVGTGWEQGISQHLNDADIILLLISNNFLDSDYCYTVEMKHVLERYEHQGTPVVPVLLHSCPWESTSLAQFNILPKSLIPVAESPDPEEAFCDIAKELRYMVENLLINKWRTKGNELYRQGNLNEALPLYEKILRLKNSLAASVDVGNVLTDLKKYEEALRVYDTFAQMARTDNRPSWRASSNIDEHLPISTFSEEEVPQEASRTYEQIFQQNVPAGSAYPWLGMTREDVPVLPTNADQSTIDRLNQAIQRNPMNPFLYHLKGNILFQLKQHREALGAYEQAVQLQESFDLARQYLAEALEEVSQQVYRKFDELVRHDQEKAQALVYYSLGLVAQEHEKWQEAEGYHQRALQIQMKYNDRDAQADTYHQLGGVAEEQRRWQVAEGYYQQALQIYVEYNDLHRQKSTYYQLGIVAEEQHKWQVAEGRYQQALQIKVQYNDRYEQARMYHQLGKVVQEQHRWQEAEGYYQQALQTFVEYNDRYSQATTYHQLGTVAQEQHRWQEAEGYYQRALQIFLEQDDFYAQANVYHQLGVIAGEQGRWEEADGYYQQALQAKGEHNAQARTYHQLGVTAEEQRKWQEAGELFIQSLSIFQKYDDTQNSSLALKSLTQLWQESNDASIPERVASVLEVSREEAEKLLQDYLKKE